MWTTARTGTKTWTQLAASPERKQNSGTPMLGRWNPHLSGSLTAERGCHSILSRGAPCSWSSASPRRHHRVPWQRWLTAQLQPWKAPGISASRPIAAHRRRSVWTNWLRGATALTKESSTSPAPVLTPRRFKLGQTGLSGDLAWRSTWVRSRISQRSRSMASLWVSCGRLHIVWTSPMP